MTDRWIRNRLLLVMFLTVSSCGLGLRLLAPDFRTPGAKARRRLVPASALRSGPAVPLRQELPPAGSRAASALAETTLFADDFEGAFPGGWQLFYTDGSTGATVWGRSTYRKAGGSASAWCAGGGSSPQPAGGPYAPNMGAWLYYGPFDLSDASDATIEFDMWNDCEPSSASPPPDMLTLYLSTDDFMTNEHQQGVYFGNTNGQWVHVSKRVSDFDGIAAVGSRTAYLTFIFMSDGANQREGTYLDNFVLRKTTGAAACSLSCGATVPTTGTTGVPVAFAGTADPSNCAGTPSYSWTFGDGASSSGQNPAHTYASAGVYPWTLTVSLGGVTCQRSGTITIAGPPQPSNPAFSAIYWLPVASHAPGAQGSQWRTDLGLLNLGAEAANVETVLHVPGNPFRGTVTVAAGSQGIYPDIVGQLGWTGSCPLEVRSDQPLHLTSRTYNQAANGTFGQDTGGIEEGAGAFAGQTVYLPQLIENAAYRTNISLTNTGETQASVLVELFEGSGSKLADYQVGLAPGEWKQENRPFSARAGRSDLSRAYARVSVTSGTGILASAAVIDNATNDPTNVPTKPTPEGNLVQWLPVISHAPGAEGSQWRTDLGLLNLGASPVTVAMRLHTQGGLLYADEIVGARAQAIVADVANRFSFTGSAALEIAADQPVALTSRTYNLGASGTVGQDTAGAKPSEGAAAGETFVLPQLVENAAFRTNIALTNTGPTPAAATVELFAGGSKLTEYAVTLAPGEWKQENRPFRARAGKSDMAAGYAKVTITSGSGVIALGSVIDNATNDPTGVPMKHVGVGTIRGKVVSLSGAPVTGATVAAGGGTAVTDGAGGFTIAGVRAGQRVAITVGKNGCVDATEITTVRRGGVHEMQLTLAAHDATASISAAAGGAVSAPDGGRVTIPANALVRADGSAFTGIATVDLLTLDPTNEVELGATPGETTGVTAAGARLPFQPFGAVDVGMTDGGQTLRLAPGKTATLRVPIPAGQRATAPSTIPLWWFDPADARWHEQGVGTRVADAYEASVSHLSTYTWAVPSDRCEVSGRFVDRDGNPLDGMLFQYVPVGGFFEGAGTLSLPDGRFSAMAPAGGATYTVSVEVAFETRTVATFTSCAGGGTMSLGDIVVDVKVRYQIIGALISGDTGTVGVPGVRVTAGDRVATFAGLLGSPYSIQDLTAGTYVVRPSKPGCTFEPATRTVTVPPDKLDADFTAYCNLVPGAFSLLEPANGSVVMVDPDPGVMVPVTLRWQASQGATEYIVVTDSPDGGGSGESPTAGTSSVLYPYRSSTYSWRVRAVNAAGETPSSSGTWTFTTVVRPPAQTPTPTPIPTATPTATPIATPTPTFTPTGGGTPVSGHFRFEGSYLHCPPPEAVGTTLHAPVLASNGALSVDSSVTPSPPRYDPSVWTISGSVTSTSATVNFQTAWMTCWDLRRCTQFRVSGTFRGAYEASDPAGSWWWVPGYYGTATYRIEQTGGSLYPSCSVDRVVPEHFNFHVIPCGASPCPSGF